MKNFLKMKNKYAIVGCCFIVFVFLVVMFVTSKSYALEGFGKINLSCDKTIAVGGDSISCNVTGTVVSTSQVSSLSSQVELSDNLEFVSFTADSIWEGNGDDGNIQLYTDNNKSETFNLGTLVVKVKSGITNTTENITLKDNYFYDVDFVEQSIDDVFIDVKTPQYSSNVYDLSNDYIISNTKDIATIINNVNTEGCSVSIDNNGQVVTSGNIVENAKLKLSSGDNLLKEFEIVYIGSNVYDLSNNYIFTSVNDLVNIIDEFETINGSLSIKNGQLVLSYNSTGIMTYDILNINSNIYKIDLSNNYIFVNEEISNNLLDNISKSDNITFNINSSNLDVRYQGNVVRTLKVLNIFSDKYDINLDDEYIYTQEDVTLESITSNVSKNVTLSVSNNKLKISYNNISIMDLNILSISTNKYTIDNQNGYIFTKSDNNIDNIKKNVNLVNVDVIVNDSKLQLKYKDNVVKEFDWYYISSEEYKIVDDNIYIKGAVGYNEFIDNISLDGLNFEIYNVDGDKVSSGSIDDNFSIKVLKDSKELTTYTIKTEYLEITNLDVNEEAKIIYNIDLGTTYEELLKNVDTSGTIKIYDIDGSELNPSNNVLTSSILKITLSSITYEYKIAVYGDVTGSGDVNAGDIAKLYQFVRGKREFNNVEVLAGDVTRDGQVLINDVSKLYSYLRGKLTTLD